MAGDWIKMRTDLYRDPKVCMIADALMSPEGALARYVDQNEQRNMTITRNVLRNATVGSLVTVWGVMRLRGRRNGDDLVCAKATLVIIDDIAEMPGFGAAMQSVGWVEETDDGLVFNNFFKELNTDPCTPKRTAAAERQHRYRERQKAQRDVTSNVTSNVTVTPREEKRREEYKNPPIGPPLAEKSKKTQSAKALPAHFELTDSMRAYSLEKAPGLDPQHQLEKFNNHHTAKGSVFKDWPAAWRTWVLNAAKWDTPEPAPPNRQSLAQAMGES